MEDLRGQEDNDNEKFVEGDRVEIRNPHLRAGAQLELGNPPYAVAKISPKGIYIVSLYDFARGVSVPDNAPPILGFPYFLLDPSLLRFVRPG